VNEGPEEKWLMDSGATVHVTHSKEGMEETRPTQDTVTVGNGNEAKATLTGHLTLQSTEGPEGMILKDLLFIENFKKNIVSIPRLFKNGAKINWSENSLTLRNGGTQKLEIKKDKDESMFYFKATRKKSAGTAMTMDKKTSMDINEAHEKGGHVHESVLKKTLESFGITLQGTLKPCDGCMKAKARAKAVPKTTSALATKAGERMYLDTTGPFKPSLGGTKYDVKLVDQFSRKTWGVWVKKRSEVPKLVAKHLESLKALGKDVKFLRCDNAGEHGEKLETICKENGTTLEKTAPYTPQQNGVVERKIYTDKNRAHAMLISARLNQETQDLLRAEAVATTEKISNLLCGPDGKSPNTMFSEEQSKLKAQDLVEFGRIGYVADRSEATESKDVR
jgi:hypothetical protein